MVASGLFVCFAFLFGTIMCQKVTSGSFGAFDAIDETSSKIPEFAEPIANVTVAVGKEAVLTCSIRSLGEFKVVWMKADDQTVFSIHKRLVPQSSKYGLTYDGTRIWRLHIRHAKETDRGCYVCQINTSPMKQQSGCIEVLVPPDIDDERSTSDVTVNEGDDATLTCHAKGRPQPRVVWKREDGEKIVLRSAKVHERTDSRVRTAQDLNDERREGIVPAIASEKTLSSIFQVDDDESNQIRIRRDRQKVDSFAGENLKLHRITRKMMGAFLCIASNDVPPAVSKRVLLNVNFAPNVRIETQLVGAPLGSVVRLECKVEAYPSAVNYWIKNRGNDVILQSKKYEIEEERISNYQIGISLVIREVSRNDFGTYSCVSTNSLGKGEETVRLYEIRMNTGSPSTGSYSQRLEPPVFGPTSKEDTGQEFTVDMTQQDVAQPPETPVVFDSSNLYLNRSTQLKSSSKGSRFSPLYLVSLFCSIISLRMAVS